MAGSSNLETNALKLLKSKPMSVSELSKKLNVRRDFLTGYLESMRDRGIVELVNVGRAHVYIVKGGKNERGYR